MKQVRVGVVLSLSLATASAQSVHVNGQLLTWPSSGWPDSAHPCAAAPVVVQVPGLGRNFARLSTNGPGTGVHLEVVSNGKSPGQSLSGHCLFVYSLGFDVSCAGIPMAAFDPSWTGDLLVDLGSVIAVEAGVWNGIDFMGGETWFQHTLELHETIWPLQPGWTWYTQAVGVWSGTTLHANDWVIQNSVTL